MFVEAFALTVDPAVAERGVDGFEIADGGDFCDDRLLTESEPDAGGSRGAGVEEPGVEMRGGCETESLCG